jgi:hypothetical protein
VRQEKWTSQYFMNISLNFRCFDLNIFSKDSLCNCLQNPIKRVLLKHNWKSISGQQHYTFFTKLIIFLLLTKQFSGHSKASFLCFPLYSSKQSYKKDLQISLWESSSQSSWKTSWNHWSFSLIVIVVRIDLQYAIELFMATKWCIQFFCAFQIWFVCAQHYFGYVCYHQPTLLI